MYKFVKTGETIEVEQSFADASLTQAVHPRTGRKMAVKKVFTPVGVTFRGGGFYKTDSRAKSSKSAKGSSTDSSSSTSGDSSSGSSDTSTSGSTSTSSSADGGSKKSDGSSKPASPSSASTSKN